MLPADKLAVPQAPGTLSTQQKSVSDPECCFGGKWTPNTKVLVVAMGLFATITTAQVFAAIAAHSSALMADCVSMGIDAVSYGVTAASESWPSPSKRKQERNQLITSGACRGGPSRGPSPSQLQPTA